MNNYLIKKSLTSQGFTIIESLVAITILIVGVLGPMTAATRGITDGYYAGNQLIATYLAQEALELAGAQIINDREDSQAFLNGFDSSCLTSSCAVAIIPTNISFSFSACTGANNNCKMTYNTTGGFYDYSSDSGQEFTRTLKITPIQTDKQALLEAKVTWFNKAGTPERNITLYRYVSNP
ncbi:MAG: hypothetical protein AAB677_00020 [Patescibacteria group bacterium]